MRKLLLHACCAPCLIYPRGVLEPENEISIYFFNPNIHPSMEYARRLEAISTYCEDEGLELRVGDYPVDSYFRAVAFDEDNHCLHCYRLRLREVAREAADGGYDAFTTTLTVSPYQDHEAIRVIGKEAAAEAGVAFEYGDFRDGFREAQIHARGIGLYVQPYCGCIYSERERYEKKLDRLIVDAVEGS